MNRAQPLAGMQKMMLRWQQLHPYNAVHVALLKFRISLSAMQAAVDRSIQELAFDAVSFSPCRNHLSFCVHNQSPQVCETQIQSIPGAEFDGFISNQLNTAFPEGSHSPFRFSLIQTRDSASALAITYEHAVSDAFGVARLLHSIVSHLMCSDHRTAWTVSVADLKAAFPGHERFWSKSARSRFSFSQIMWYRRCWRPRPQKLSSRVTEFCLHEPQLETDCLRQKTKAAGVTVQDYLFAATLEACCRVLQPPGRKLVAASTLVDLRSQAPEHFRDAFGLFLGAYAVRHSVQGALDFEGLLESIRHQNQAIKESRSYLCSALGLDSMAWIWDRLTPGINATLGQRLLPVVAGISNFDLSERWGASSDDWPVRNYFRATSLGVILPLMVTLTTTGATFSLTSTYRPMFYGSAQVNAIMARIADRLAGRL